MKKIGFYLRKGGVGKTTMSVSIAFELARQGKKVCLIDCDTQGNASTWLLEENQVKGELADLLNQKASLQDILVETRENLFMIPTFGNENNLNKFAQQELVNEIFAFENINEQLEALGFDIVIYDLSPSFSLLETRIIKTLDEVIMVSQAEYFSMDGVETFLTQLDEVRVKNKSQVTSTKIIVNMLNKSLRRHKDILEVFKDREAFDIFVVGQNSKIAESQMAKQDIYEYDPTNKVVEDIKTISSSILKGV